MSAVLANAVAVAPVVIAWCVFTYQLERERKQRRVSARRWYLHK